MYDWANSPFSTSVITVFLGPYFTSIAHDVAGAKGYIQLLGFRILPGTLYPYLLSLSLFCRFILLPQLGVIGDKRHCVKSILGLFAYTGAASTILMYG